jgi:hypothetical protein
LTLKNLLENDVITKIKVGSSSVAHRTRRVENSIVLLIVINDYTIPGPMLGIIGLENSPGSSYM